MHNFRQVTAKHFPQGKGLAVGVRDTVCIISDMIDCLLIGMSKSIFQRSCDLEL